MIEPETAACEPLVPAETPHWKATFDINVLGIFLLSQAVIPSMKAAGRGRIINAASFAAIVPSIGSAASAASKAAVVQFMRVLAGELGPWNITVNCYEPGMIPTAMNGFADMPESAQALLLDTLSLRRWESADDVADLLCFLRAWQVASEQVTFPETECPKPSTMLRSCREA